MATAVGVRKTKEGIAYYAILNGKALFPLYYGPDGPGKAVAELEREEERLHLENSLLEIDEEELDEFPDEYGLVIVLKDGLSHEYSFHDGDGNYDEDAQTQKTIEDARALAQQHSSGPRP